MNTPTIIEYSNQRVLTTQQLAEVYETSVDNIKKNFQRNKERFVKGKHYHLLEGDDLKDFKNRVTDSPLVGKNASQLILWTEKGADRHCKILDTDKAWEQFDNLEDTYFRVKELVNQSKTMEDIMIYQLQEMKRLKEQTQEAKTLATEVKEEIQGMRDVITLSPRSWRNGTSNIITRIAQKLGGNEYIQTVRQESYNLLEERGHYNLKQRLANRRKTLADNGVSKSKRDKLNKLDIIESDPRILECYLAVVKEMAIKYGITVSNALSVPNNVEPSLMQV